MLQLHLSDQNFYCSLRVLTVPSIFTTHSIFRLDFVPKFYWCNAHSLICCPPQEICTRFMYGFVLLGFGIYWFHPWHLGLLHWHHGNHSVAAVSECNHEWYSDINRPNLLWTIIYPQHKYNKTCTYLIVCLVIYCICILDIQPFPFAAMYDTGYTEIFASYMILRVLWTSSVLWNGHITASHNINMNNPLMRLLRFGQRWTRPVNMAYNISNNIYTRFCWGFKDY